MQAAYRRSGLHYTRGYTMYHLTLTYSERRALEFVGNRYSNGDALYRLLWRGGKQTPDDANWDDARDITFHVDAHTAWEIRENAKQDDGYWPCFATELAEKMQAFVDGIV